MSNENEPLKDTLQEVMEGEHIPADTQDNVVRDRRPPPGPNKDGEEPTPEEIQDAIDDDDYSLAQDIRRRIISDVYAVSGGRVVDKDSAGIVLKALDGIDKQITARRRQRTEEKVVDQEARAQELIRTVLGNVDRSTLIPSINATAPVPEPTIDDEILNSIPDFSLEMEHIEESSQEFDERMNRQGNRHK